MTKPSEPHEFWGRLLNGVGTRKDAEDAVLHLRAVLMEVMPLGSAPCALSEHNGRRTLAQQLINHAASLDLGTERNASDDADADLRRIRARRRAAAERSAPQQRGAARRVGK